MEHRMTVRSNPRILLLFAVVAAMGVATVLGFVLLSPLYGVIFLAVALFLSYQFVRFARSHMKSHVETDEEGVTFFMPGGESERFEWKEISQSGYCTQAKGRPFAFIYSEERDRLITIPSEYEHFETLLATFEERLEYDTFELAPGVTIQAKLRELLGLPDPADAEEEAETDPPADE